MRFNAMLALALILAGCGHNFKTEARSPTGSETSEANVGVTSSEFMKHKTTLSIYQECLVDNEGDPNRDAICNEYNDLQDEKLTGRDLCLPNDYYCIYTRSEK